MSGTELSRRTFLVGLGGAGGLGLLMACRPTPSAPAPVSPPTLRVVVSSLVPQKVFHGGWPPCR